MGDPDLHPAGAKARRRKGERRARTHDGDAELINGVRRAERAALQEVYRRHGGNLYFLASRVCGPGHASDVVQQVLHDLWREPRRFSPTRSSLQSFLAWQTHAAAVRVLRDSREREGGANRLEPGSQPDGDLTAWLSDRVGARAWRRLSSLPDESRNAIALAYYCGRSCDELSELLEQPPELSRRQIRSGLMQLAGHVDG